MKYKLYIMFISVLTGFLLKLSFIRAIKVVFFLRKYSLKSSFVTNVIDYQPYKCLKKALIATMVSHQRPAVFFGVKKGQAGLEAHAWAKVGERYLTGRSGHEEFKVIAVFR